MPTRRILAAALGLVLVALAYLPLMSNAFINFDDQTYILENRHVTSGLRRENIAWAFTAFTASNYHPLTWLAHMCVAELGGMNPTAHHLASLALHLANTLLVIILLAFATGRFWPALMAALLFGLHPLHVESVAWAAELKDVLSTFFGLLALIFYIAWTRRARAWPLIGSLLAYAASLLAKPMLVSLPLLLFILDFWPLGRFNAPGARKTRLALEKAPFALLAGAACLVTLAAQWSGGAVRTVSEVNLAARSANALTAYAAYLAKTVWPVDLAIFYPHPGLPPLGIIAGALGVLALMTLLVWRQRAKRPYLAAGWAWYLVSLAPAIGMVQVGSQAMADRYTYLPLLGVFVGASWFFSQLARARPTLARPLAAGAALVLVVLAGLTWRQAGFFRDSQTLFTHALMVTKNNHLAHLNLALALDEAGRTDEAMGHLEKSLAILPTQAIAHNNLGNILMRENRPAEAASHYERAVELKPAYAKARFNLALAYARLGLRAKELATLTKAHALAPEDPDILLNLGVAQARAGNPALALQIFERLVRLVPNQARAHYNLGVGLANLGRHAEALASYRAALNLDPASREAGLNLAHELLNQGRRPEGLNLLAAMAANRPQDWQLAYTFGLTLLNSGQTIEARRQLARAVALNPGFAQAETLLKRLESEGAKTK